jgi:phosphatidylglycerophosphate synthase
VAAANDLCSLGIHVSPLILNQLKDKMDGPGENHFLLFSDHMIFPAKLAREMLQKNLQPEENLLLIARSENRAMAPWEGIPLDLSEDGGEAVAVSSPDESSGTFACGPALIAGRGLLQLSRCLEQAYSHEGLRNFLSDRLATDKCYVEDLYPYFCTSVKDKKTYKIARFLLLKSTRKETDGAVSRYINRYVSLLISRGALALGIRANHITLTNLVVGIASALFLAAGGYINTAVGGVLFQFTSILDGSDGEVAKLSFRASPTGAWLDTFCDQTITLLVFIGLIVGLYRDYGNSLYIFLGVIAVTSVIALQILLDMYVKKTRGTGSTVKVVKDIEEEGHSPRKAGQTTVQRVFSILFSRVGFLVRRDVYALLFMMLCLLSWQALFLWGLAVVTPGAAIYVLLYYLKKN